MRAVGTSIPHDSSRGHVMGQAPYLDDLPLFNNELIVGFVGSPVAHGVFRSVDLSEAAKIPGIAGLYTAADIGGHNLYGPIFQDERFLVDDTCNYIGEPIVVIAGESGAAVEQAKHAITLEVEPWKPILTIEEAIAAGAFLCPPREFRRGDVIRGFRDSVMVLEGVFHSGGQEHLYLESQSAIAYPGEDNQISVHSSTQNPTEIQHVVAHVLGLGMHQVVCTCKRMGGGFGGKETQATLPALMVALVALKTGRPARIVYSKDEDMKFTGKRHPYQAHYKVGFDLDGRILALDVQFYSDGGASADLSSSIMDRSLFHIDNAYFLPNVVVRGRVCKTNLPSNTAFRGFGGPQAVAAIENILEEIALTLRKDAYEIRLLNCYGIEERNVTHYGQLVTNNLLPVLLPQLAESADYKSRLAAIKAFNAVSETHLKGIALTPVKFGISFTTKFLNQGNALVNIYTDGTVQVSTGGTEMGQGLNTKIRQLVADALGIPLDSVQVMVTSTEKNNNTSATAASASTDLNGTAAVLACQTLRARLAQFAADYFAQQAPASVCTAEHIKFEDGVVYDGENPIRQISFGELANLARRERIDLGARGFYKTPDIHFDYERGQGSPFFYYTTGAAVAEVLVDRWTGELTVPRVDLLVDIGKSINPGIDMGQITGGFIQGLGWVTTEELVYSDDGALLSFSPTTYKIPGSLEVPEVFHVEFADNPHNTHNIGSSKATGEPPLLLAISVWAAIKHALSFGCNGRLPDLRLPATGEQILMCLSRHRARKVLDEVENEAPTHNGSVPGNSAVVATEPLATNLTAGA